MRVLEWAGILSWQHRIARVRERCRDLWGREGWRWRVVRTSNAYVFRDPVGKTGPVWYGTPGGPHKVACHPAGNCGFRSECKNSPRTLNPVVNPTLQAPVVDPGSPLERVLASLGTSIATKDAYGGSR